MAEATIIKVRTDRLLIKAMGQHLDSREKTFNLWITNHSLLRRNNEGWEVRWMGGLVDG